MSFQRFVDSSGAMWEYDPEGLWRIVRPFAYARILRHRTRKVRTESSYVSGWGPDVVSVDTDWRNIHAEADGVSRALMQTAERNLMAAPQSFVYELASMRRQTFQYHQAIRTLQIDAIHESMGNIQSSVEHREQIVAGLRIVRDISGEVLVTGATVMSGGTAGAAFAALGAGAFCKGMAEYDETGSVGAAVYEATATIVVGAIPIVGGLPSVQLAADAARAERLQRQVVLVFVGTQIDAGLEAGKTFVHGGSLEEAVRAAAARALLDAADPLVGHLLEWSSKRLFPVAAKIRLNRAARVAQAAILENRREIVQTAGQTVANLVGGVVVDRARQAGSPAGGQTESTAGRQAGSSAGGQTESTVGRQAGSTNADFLAQSNFLAQRLVAFPPGTFDLPLSRSRLAELQYCATQLGMGAAEARMPHDEYVRLSALRPVLWSE